MTPPVATLPPAAPTRPASAPLPDAAPTLSAALATALADGHLPDALSTREPRDRRDRFLSLLAVYDLWTLPLQELGDAVRLQGSPVLAAVKGRLEAAWMEELEASYAAADLPDASTPDGAVAAMRAVAARDRLPAAYRWLAREADWPEVVDFLALEGGPDGGFDDLVAVCQVGLSGSAKLELAKNYWDEMGQGDADGVHTTLYERLVEAIAMPRVPRADLPVEALERAALGGLLATNRWLQPEMVGALGLLELQAGPRCRLVLQAFERLDAPAAAFPFYVEHAEVDPVHGKDWMDKAVVPTVTERPEWGRRIVQGAYWRSTINLAFFEALRRDLESRTVAA